MIDTIILLIPPQYFKILRPQDFVPSTDLVYQNQVIKAVLNNPKKHVYFPRLTLSRRMNLQGRGEIMLTIEASLPKLLFGNNLHELRYKDLEKIIATLYAKLIEMGIEIEPIHQMPEDIAAQTADSLEVLHQDKIKFHTTQINKLTQEHKSITNMMNNLYLDK